MRVVIVGGGGHAKVVIDILQLSGEHDVIGVLDQGAERSGLLGVPILGGDDMLETLKARGAGGVIVALGDNQQRRALFNRAVLAGLEPVNAIHPTAIISRHSRVGRGIVMVAHVAINADCEVGDNVILNTSSSVDHDGRIGESVHIAPGCHLSGNVTVGEGAFIGTGCSVKDGISIGAWSVIGAGTAVYRDVPAKHRVVGGHMRFL